ncbi:MAG: hypothetical protein ACREOZ_02755 [Gloeomargaritales cyanobacterium]
MASKFAHDILQETRREQGQKDQNCWIFVQYLENLRRKEKSFTFRINTENKGIPSCVVWMTPAMRAAFERFGWFVCLDAMKRQLNQFHWPYVGPVVLDENRKVTVIAEAFVNSETLDQYAFIMKSIFEMAPGRTKENVAAIYGDCFLRRSLIDLIGMPLSTRVFWDHYHLLQQVWPRGLGPYWFERVRLCEWFCERGNISQ